MQGNIWLAVLIVLPVIGAFPVYAVDRNGGFHSGNKPQESSKRYSLAFGLASAITGIVLVLMALLASGFFEARELWISGVCGMGLHFQIDGFRGLYGCLAALMWMAAMLFSKEYFIHAKQTGRYLFFNLWTLGATLGVFLSADLYTTFLFFEMMSFTSYVWVAQEESEEALRAGQTYLAVSVIGGLALLMGLFLLYHELGTLEIAELFEAAQRSQNRQLLTWAGLCVFVGFGAKAGAVPLHIWLPKAHPVAPAPASALLSGMLTKAGIFGIAVISCQIFWENMAWGSFLLWIGVLTMFGGALLAVFSVNLKRTLACSSMSQIGFVLIGLGMQGILGEENALAVRGTLLHMVNHSLFKLVLFLAAGVVAMNLHKLDLNEIRGFGRGKPLLHFAFAMGALGISGIPFWNGYISKTLLHESIVEGLGFGVPGIAAAEWIFLISGGMTFAYMLKLYIAIFWEKHPDAQVQKSYDALNGCYMSKLSAAALTLPALLFPLMGCFSHQIMDRLADFGQGFFRLAASSESVAYLSWGNLKGAAISVVIGAAVYFLLIRGGLMKKRDGVSVYWNGWPKWLDLEDRIYRPLLLDILPFLFGVLCRILDSLLDGLLVLLRKTVYRDRKIPHELEEGSAFTHLLGSVCDWARRCRRRLLHRETLEEISEENVSYEHKFAVIREELIETNTIIRRSLSFGLLLFYVGLVFTLLYLLWG